MPDEPSRRDAPAAGAWRPRFGAWLEHGTVHARVWAPGRRTVELLLERRDTPARGFVLAPEGDGLFARAIPGARAGDRYRYLLDGEGPFPDPASRSQPDGVHGGSEVVDARAFDWTDAAWCLPPPESLVIYELHTGAFTPAGTFDGVARRLAHLRELGVNALELMPVAAFPGRWNWGYDGAALYAPARLYGGPDALRRLVNAAHRAGLAVLLDVVYNHLGPDGAYLAAFAPPVFSAVHRTPWGAAINFDGPGSRQVRDFFIDNALHWIHEYHIDGLRLDATHAIVDESPRPFLAELAERVRAGAGRDVVLIAEDHRNLAIFARSPRQGGWGYTGTWSDDFHHGVRPLVAGDDDGYFADFRDSTADLATTIRQGWLYTGQPSAWFEAARGTDPTGLPPHAFTFYLQNHDQVGNRALGDRLHTAVDTATLRALTVLLLCAPEMPLLFMGQEWAASAPFRYFTDHHEALGRSVTEGRRAEFARFRAFSAPETRERVPDPQSPGTFAASRLNWDEAAQPGHAGVLALHRALLQLRRSEPLVAGDAWEGFACDPAGPDALVMRRGRGETSLAVVVRLRGRGEVSIDSAGTPVDGEAPGMAGSSDAAGTLPVSSAPGSGASRWRVVLHSEEARFTPDPVPPVVTPAAHGVTIAFGRPGAAVLRAAAPGTSAAPSGALRARSSG